AVLDAWTITAAREPNADKYTVPKTDLVAAVQVGLGTGSLIFADGLKYGPLLGEELKAFRSKVTEARNEVYSAREGANDDLCLALALACWQASLWSDPAPFLAANAENVNRRPWTDLPPGPFRDESAPGWGEPPAQALPR